MSIRNIPLDVWSTIMIFIDPQDLVATYEKLYESNILNIDEKERLSTFWILMSLARISNVHMEKFEELPDSRMYVDSFEKLKDMGLPIEQARKIVEQAQGNLQDAFDILGWD